MGSTPNMSEATMDATEGMAARGTWLYRHALAWFGDVAMHIPELYDSVEEWNAERDRADAFAVWYIEEYGDEENAPDYVIAFKVWQESFTRG